MKVIALTRYPVKSMQGESLESCGLGPLGIDGDRSYGVVDNETGKVLSAKTEPRLFEAEGRTDTGKVVLRLPGSDWLEADDPAATSAVRDWLGSDVHVERAGASQRGYTMPFPGTVDGDEIEVPCPPERFFDLAPIHLLTTASLRTMESRRPGSEWSPWRFRPNVLVETDQEGFIEEEWIGRTIRVGEAVLEPFMPTIRCSMTTRAQRDLPRDLEILKGVNSENGSSLGIYCSVPEPGKVAVGNAVSDPSAR